MSTRKDSRRRRERIRIALPTIVQCRESAESEWSELTRLVDVTPFGASFGIKHRVEAGRLIHMTLPMPRQMRCFDHIADQYRVWALVRHVKELPVVAGAKNQDRFAVGVAFVGKNPPESYDLNPGKLYDAAGEDAPGGDQQQPAAVVPPPPAAPAPPPVVRPSSPPPSFGIGTTQANASSSARAESRFGTRLTVPVDVILELVGEHGAQSLTRERTVTENISRRGASILTAVKVGRGTRVRLTSANYGISVNALVLARRVGADGLARLHVKFTDEQWPLEGVD